MTLTNKIYEDLLVESHNESIKRQVTQRYILPNKEEVVFAISCEDKSRHFYFKSKQEDLERMPVFKGIEYNIVKLQEYDNNAVYCNLVQVKENESYIFEVIIESIRENLMKCKAPSITGVIIQTLNKWKDFFANKKQLLMSPERQQGLYGELRFLENLINLRGTKAVLCWSGCKYETHDFYISGNGIEVKTTSKKAPYKIHISSEYQLDDNDVTGELFICFYAFRRSESDGDSLVSIIQRIRSLISCDPYAKGSFDRGLEEYGYFDIVSEKYKFGYVERIKTYFKIQDGFPRIIPNELSSGISNCTYDVLVDECQRFEVSEYKIENTVLKEGLDNDK